jgi:hypothetical protein
MRKRSVVGVLKKTHLLLELLRPRRMVPRIPPITKVLVDEKPKALLNWMIYIHQESVQQQIMGATLKT